LLFLEIADSLLRELREELEELPLDSLDEEDPDPLGEVLPLAEELPEEALDDESVSAPDELCAEALAGSSSPCVEITGLWGGRGSLNWHEGVKYCCCFIIRV